MAIPNSISDPLFSTNKYGESFASPYLDIASASMPTDNRSVLKWCEHLFMRNETLRMAIERIIAYFLTDIEIGAATKKKSLGEDERDKWRILLNDHLQILLNMQAIDRDLLCYGNAFISVITPFKRMLTCRNCKSLTLPLRTVYDNPEFSFRFDHFKFKAKCPKCKYSGEWLVKDEPDNLPHKLKLKRWPVHNIHMEYNEITDDKLIYMKIPETYRKEFFEKDVNIFHLERTSLEMLRAIKDNTYYKFDPNGVYHMFEPALCGLQNKCWGISRLMTCFRQLHYVQVLRRYNEAIAMDYVVPFRVITPAARGGQSRESSDLLLSGDAGNFMASVRRMIAARRKNPAEWNTLPFPVEYQALGGDAQQLAPEALLNQGLETLLNGIGTPVELYKGSLQLQSAPVAMRLFEATWGHLVNSNNSLLRWLTDRLAAILGWEKISAKHRRVQHADDMQRHMALLQLMTAGTISQTTGLRALGLEFLDESRQIQEEARAMQRQQNEMQEEMDTENFGKQISAGVSPQQQQQMEAQQQQGGQPAPQGGSGFVDPMTGQQIVGPVTSMVQNNYLPQTPDEMLAQAQSVAQQLLGLPESQKDSELRMLKQKNEVLHSLVKAQLNKIRTQARSQGGAMLLSQGGQAQQQY